MNRSEYEFLCGVRRRQKNHFSKLSSHENQLCHLLMEKGYLENVYGDAVEISDDGHAAMQEYLRSSESRDLQQRSIAAQEKSAASVEKLSAELEQLRKEFAEFKRQHADQHAQNDRQAELDFKKVKKHDYLMSAITFVLAVIADHIVDIINLLK